jgi:hypothetical protein
MHELLLALCVTLGFPHAPLDVLSAIERHAPDDATARLMTVWAAHESGFSNNPTAWSHDAKDGSSRCFLQVRASMPLSLDECAARWLGVLHAGQKLCGSLEGALRVLSSGRCSGAAQLVRKRMAEAGLSPAL